MKNTSTLEKFTASQLVWMAVVILAGLLNPVLGGIIFPLLLSIASYRRGERKFGFFLLCFAGAFVIWTLSGFMFSTSSSGGGS